MRIRHLSIRNFRGIKELDWKIDARTVCLIGPNDSTKSTVLEAIQLVLHPWWNPSVSDSDFYQQNVSEPIVIKATVGELPESLQSLQKYGGYLRGWNNETVLSDEPGINDEAVLTIKFIVDQSLEPNWNVCCCRDETSIGYIDRQKLGVSRVGSYVDRDMTWRKGSALYRVTEKIKGAEFAGLSRRARAALSAESLDELSAAARNVEDMAQGYGVKPVDKFHPEFDPENIDINAGSLSLHDTKVPFRLQGLGTRRLTSLAMQRHVTNDGTILLIDEVEHALEPFRVRQLVRNLRDATHEIDGQRLGQVFFTTHSPVALEECKAGEWHIVRNETGLTAVTQVKEGIEATIRSSAEALLSRKVIVCEGKTEVGILRAFDRDWAAKHNGASLAYFGVCAINGGGSEAAKRAINLRSLGYEVALLVDSDREITPSKCEVESHGILVVKWPGKVNTEQRIFLDVDIDTINRILDWVTAHHVEESELMKDIGGRLQLTGFSKEMLDQLLADPSQSTNVRATLGSMASSKKYAWFKRTDLGEYAGKIISDSIGNVPCSEFYNGISAIEDWVFQE